MNAKNKKTAAAAIIIVAILILVGVFAYFEYFEQEKVTVKTEQVKEIDDRISPYTNQGITIEILRMRHRGLTDLLSKFTFVASLLLKIAIFFDCMNSSLSMAIKRVWSSISPAI